jgi:hypothetical protein
MHFRQDLQNASDGMGLESQRSPGLASSRSPAFSPAGRGNSLSSKMPRSSCSITKLYVKRAADRIRTSDSGLRRHGQTAPVYSIEDLIAAATKQRGAHIVAQLFRVVNIAVAGFAEKLRAIGIGDDRLEM